ncbi:MAG: sulfite exporter TauE/SafE family protein [Bacteroidia bacterium]|nr:sulfite exporter TauE/SafE family protein [Bacteroidia bacterium]MDW8347085.1 sulfite exporter TauE/SafE family protein [Bacteroidia bacterium]
MASTLSAVAGFGGALILLPILSLILGVKAAVPVLTLAQFFGNAARVWFNRKDLCWQPILYFLSTAIPLSIIGSYLFAKVQIDEIKKVVGCMLIGVVIYRRARVNLGLFTDKVMLIGGGLVGFLSGLAGSAGPLSAACFLSLNLNKSAYVGSEAFTAIVMHAVKTVVYQRWLDINAVDVFVGVFMGVIMILGSWVGKQLLQKLEKKYFILLVEFLLIVSGVQFILSF